MNQATLEQFKNLFTNILIEAQEEQTELWEELSSNKNGDLVDQALGDREQSLALKLKGRNSFFLKKVKGALEKIENGTFGTCEECDCEISTHRLLARPTANLCITCKEEQEIGEKHVTYDKKSHTHGMGINNSEKLVSINFSEGIQESNRKTVGIAPGIHL